MDVNESYINRVTAGQPVTAVLDAYPDWQIPGHVITTVPTADRQKATVLVRIGFDELDPRILPDMGVKVTFLREADATADCRGAPGHAGAEERRCKTGNGTSHVFVVAAERGRAPRGADRRHRRRSRRSVGGPVGRRSRRRLRHPDSLAEGKPVVIK